MRESYFDSVDASIEAENQAQPTDVIQEIADIVQLLVSYAKNIIIMQVLLQGLDERMKYLISHQGKTMTDPDG